jgi:hypothetical protein
MSFISWKKWVLLVEKNEVLLVNKNPDYNTEIKAQNEENFKHFLPNKKNSA